ncbi:MAG: HU family DNA-binding protein [Balneolaceae bacterium]
MSKKVTYAEIIEALSQKTGFNKQKSEAFSKALIAEIKKELQETGKASITNFGSFKVKEVAERQGQNPQTGEPITIPAHKRVSFTPYKALKEKVNAKYAHLETELIDEEKSKTEPAEVAPLPSEWPEREPKQEVFTPKTTYGDRKKGNNIGLLIVAVLTLVVIALASLWFVFSSGDEQVASEKAALEQPQTPAAAEQVVPGETDSQPQTDSEAENVEAEEAKTNTQNTSTTPADVNVYTVKENEWYWRISRTVYGKPEFWPLIFQQNYTSDVHPDSLEKNIRLEIPVLEGTASNLTKGDYRRLAEASGVVSDAYRKFGRTDKAAEYERFARKWRRAGM